MSQLRWPACWVAMWATKVRPWGSSLPKPSSCSRSWAGGRWSVRAQLQTWGNATILLANNTASEWAGARTRPRLYTWNTACTSPSCCISSVCVVCSFLTAEQVLMEIWSRILLLLPVQTSIILLLDLLSFARGRMFLVSCRRWSKTYQRFLRRSGRTLWSWRSILNFTPLSQTLYVSGEYKNLSLTWGTVCLVNWAHMLLFVGRSRSCPCWHSPRQEETQRFMSGGPGRSPQSLRSQWTRNLLKHLQTTRLVSFFRFKCKLRWKYRNLLRQIQNKKLFCYSAQSV